MLALVGVFLGGVIQIPFLIELRHVLLGMVTMRSVLEKQWKIVLFIVGIVLFVFSISAL